MSNKIAFDALWDESPIDVTPEVNFIWSIANKLRGSYMPDKYGDVIIPMTILRRLECALEPHKEAVLAKFAENPNYPPKAMYRISGYQFYNTSPYTLKELCNEPDNIKSNFKVYIQGFSAEVQEIFNGLEMFSHIDKMDKDGCLFSVVQAFADLDLDPKTYDSIKMGYIFEHLVIAQDTCVLIIKLPADRAYQWGNSRLDYWRIARSPVLKCSITNKRLAAAGYFSILNYYESLYLCG